MPALTRSVQNPHLPSVNRKLNAGDPPRFITSEIHGGPGHVPAGPRRLQRYRQASLLTYFLSVLRHEGVSTIPTTMQLTRMLSAASSAARDRVRPLTPAFAVE